MRDMNNLKWGHQYEERKTKKIYRRLFEICFVLREKFIVVIK